MSAMARRLRLAVAITSSCRHELPAATALAVAMVMPFVMRMKSSGVETLAGGTGEEKTCEERGRRGSSEVRGGGRAARQPRHRRRTHGQLLADVLDCGLQCPCPLRGLVLDSLHCLQQGGDVCHHHLQKERESQVNPPACSQRLSFPRGLVPNCPIPTLHSHCLSCSLCSTSYVSLPTLLS